jgi:DNA-binding CsgD family transcriptional regulator
MPDREHELSDVIGAIYDCTIDHSLWPAALERVSAYLATGSVFITINDLKQPEKSRFVAAHGIDYESAKDYKLHHAHANPFLFAGMIYDVDEVARVGDALDLAEFRESLVYRNWMAPRGWGDIVGSILMKDASSIGTLASMRHASSPPFTDEDLRRIRLLTPHVRRTLTISRLIDHKTKERNRFATIIDALATSVFLVDAHGRIVHQNASAQQLMNGGLVFVRGATLRAVDPQSQRALQAALAMPSKETRPVPLTTTAGTVLAASVLPLTEGSLRASATGEYAAVFVHEPADMTPQAGEILGRLFKLTGAELRVLLALVDGKTPAEIAAHYGISVATVKSQMSRLFDKTDTARQSELVARVVKALPPITGEPRS